VTHTRGEWEYIEESPHGRKWIRAKKDRALICGLTGEHADYDNNKANAKRIVQCVNAHDEFVIACEFAIENKYEPDKWRTQMEQALKSAKGGE